MKRPELDLLVEELQAMMLARGGRLALEIGPPASEEELAACESAIGLPLPLSLREMLTAFNGAAFEVFTKDPEDAGGELHWSGDYVIPSTESLVEHTILFRSYINDFGEAWMPALSQMASQCIQAEYLYADLYILLLVDPSTRQREHQLLWMDSYTLEMKKLARTYGEHVRLSLQRMVHSGTDFVYWDDHKLAFCDEK